LRIVVRAPDARSARDAQSLLAAARISAAAMPGPWRPAPDGEDLAIFPALAGGSDVAAALARQTAQAERAPLARLVGLAGAEPPGLGLAEHDAFTSAVTLDAPPKLLAAQIEAAIRLAIAEEECARRAATAASIGAPAPQPIEPRKLKALYIGAPSAMFLALERVLAEQGGLVAAAFSSYAGFDHLHDEPFDAVVLNGAQDAAKAISLCAALRRNATLYHLPTMVVTAPGDDATAAAAIDRGASAVTEANAPCGPSLGWLFEAVRRERRRRRAEHDMRALRDLMGEPRTGLFQRAAFDAHLARLAADHHMSGRPMALAALRVLPAHGAREPSPDAWKRGFNEIASLAGRLMRDADSGAAIGGDIIAIALPAAALKSAKRTAERIAAVAECTAFASGDGGVGPLVFEQSAVELQPGESGAGMLARALRAIEVEAVPA
jgi:two-component system cell cycle response regulator PopA